MNLRQIITAILTSLLTACLCGCGGSSSSHASHLLYVTTGQGVYGYRIQNGSGNATPLPFAPFVIGNGPAGIALSPSGNFTYVANEDDNTLSLLKIDPTSGILAEVLPRTPSGGFAPGQILMDSTGSTLFVANQQSNSVTAFSVGASGALTQSSAVSVGSQPSNLAAANGLLFVAVPNFSRVYVFSVSSGALTAVNGSPFLVSNGVVSVTVDPSAKFLYVPNVTTDTISGFSIQYSSASNTMTLTPIAGSPFVPNVTTIPSTPIAALLDKTSTHLYVTNFNSASVSQFAIGTNGSLASLSPPTASVGTHPSFLALDPDGNHVFIADTNSIDEVVINSDSTLGATNASISVPTVPQGFVLTK